MYPKNCTYTLHLLKLIIYHAGIKICFVCHIFQRLRFLCVFIHIFLLRCKGSAQMMINFIVTPHDLRFSVDLCGVLGFFFIERYIGLRLLRVDVKHKKNLEWPYHTDTINFEIDFVSVQFYWLQLFLEAHKTYYINVGIMICIDYLWPMKTWVSRNNIGRERVYRAVWPQTSKKLQRPNWLFFICNILIDKRETLSNF